MMKCNDLTFSIPVLKWDYRIGGMPIQYISFDGGHLVKVPNEIRKCVAFLAYKDNGGIKLAGTVFFVGISLPDTTISATYAITAKHVIEGIKKKTVDNRVYFRLNYKDIGAELAYMDLKDWYYHPTDASNVDVAVVPMPLADNMDHLLLPYKDFATEEIILKEKIGIGEEVFLTGLFIHHMGAKRNIPIIRVGNISAMPEEPINTQGFSNMEAYLVEARSIGGLSGSPVFVHLGIIRNVDGQTKFATSPEGIFYLLGLMHGHWDLSVSDIDGIAEDEVLSRSINMGIGIVVPAKKIAEVLNQPKLEEMRKEMIADWKRQTAATPDYKDK
jgi:hypothetical protein